MPDQSQISAMLRRAQVGQARSHEKESRLNEQKAKNGVVAGRASIICSSAGVSNALVEIKFPVSFVDQPLFLYGADLPSYEWPDDCLYPSLHATVIDWIQRELTDDRRYYVGALVACRTSGWIDMEIFLNYLFLGVSLRNPVTSTLDLGEVL